MMSADAEIMHSGAESMDSGAGCMESGRELMGSNDPIPTARWRRSISEGVENLRDRRRGHRLAVDGSEDG